MLALKHRVHTPWQAMGGLVAIKGSNSNWLGSNYNTDAPGLVSVLGNFETYRIHGGSVGHVCIATCHDNNEFAKWLVAKTDLSSAQTHGTANVACPTLAIAHWHIYSPLTASDGQDWGTVSGDAKRVVMYNVHANKYLGVTGGNVVFKTTYGADDWWEIHPRGVP